MNLTSFDAVLGYVKQAVQSSLDTHVAPVVKRVESETIEKEVYHSYAPLVYQRRKSSGGLGSQSNMEHTVIGTTLEVVNTAPPNPEDYGETGGVTTDKDLPTVVETGVGYDFGSGGLLSHGYTRPREFTKKTIETLQSTEEHVEALKQGLRSFGLDVK